MKKNLFIVTIVALLGLFVACEEKELVLDSAPEGLPAYINFDIKVPVNEDITVSRAVADAESEINQLTLVMFQEGNGRVEIVDLSDKLSLQEVGVADGAEGKGPGYRRYALSEDVATVSGNYKIYAIANYGDAYSDFSNLTIDESITEAQLLSKLTELSNGAVYSLTGSKRLPMSGYAVTSGADGEDTQAGRVAIYPVEDQQVNLLSISLRRLTAHIEFEFINGTGVVFTPNKVEMYHLPANARLFNSEQSVLEDASYVNTSMTVSSNTFDFLMLENVRPAGEKKLYDQRDTDQNDPYAYNDRDRWLVSAGATHPRTYPNAPDNASYVLVSGTFSSNAYNGEVSYVIHLGNFSTASSGSYETGAVNNFTVKRNEYHKYRVTVKGVDNIVTEVTTRGDELGPIENNTGAEGDLVATHNLFIVDAHYDAVLLCLTEKEINLLAASSPIRIDTPKGYIASEGTNTMTVAKLSTQDDYKWIQFQKPVNVGTSTSPSIRFPRYAGRTGGNGGTLNSGLVYITDFVKDPKSYALEVTENGEKKYYVAAFVDEFVYEDMALDKYVNIDKDRLMMLNEADPAVSVDGQSSLSGSYTFMIRQRSIKTTYTLPSTLNIAGIETWNETGATTKYTTTTTTTIGDGYSNTKQLMSGNNLLSSSSNWDQEAGYLAQPQDNLKESHLWGTPAAEFDAEDMRTTIAGVTNVMQAILARNRDENGDGVISTDELKWFMPSLLDYYAVWMGQDRLQQDTRLFEEELFTVTYISNSRPKFYTSSGDKYYIYWADQGASVSTYTQHAEGWANEGYHYVRAMRRLKNPEVTATTDVELPWRYDPVTRIFSLGDIANLRQTSLTHPHYYHTERDEANFLPPAFEVSAVYHRLLSTSGVDLDREEVEGTQNTPLMDALENGYSNVYNYSGRPIDANSGSRENFADGWRVPNQRELMLIYAAVGMPFDITEGDSEIAYVFFLSSTWFKKTASTETQHHQPFAVIANNGKGGSEWKLSMGCDVNNNYVILVRDVAPSTETPLPSTALPTADEPIAGMW